MFFKKISLLPLILLICSCSTVNKKNNEFTYKVNNIDHTGYVASGATKDQKKPGVLIVHEWWGHNEYVRKRADKLADLGYVAMALDMYGEGKTASHPKDAQAFAKQAMSNPKLVKKRFDEALKILKARPDVDSTKIAAIGYCFGGGVILNMVRNNADINLAASFHGSLGDSKTKLKRGLIKTKVLVFNGADDPMVSKEQIKNFKKQMRMAKINHEFYNFENAVHAFTNKKADEYGKKFKLPLAYDKNADEESWKAFLVDLKLL